MSPLVLATLLAVAPAAEDGPARPGVFGGGVGRELPMVGLLTGVGSESRVGVGYHLGGALGWEVIPGLQLRLYGGTGETFSGRARLRYLANVQSGEVSRVRQAAHWLHGDVGLGATWLFRSPDRALVPFAGADGGVALAGYDFYFDDSLAELEAIDVGDAFDRCTDESCRSVIHDAARFTWVATARGGVRFELATWLASQVELAVSLVPPGSERISNTVVNREVRAVRELVWLTRLTFSLWLGL